MKPCACRVKAWYLAFLIARLAEAVRVEDDLQPRRAACSAVSSTMSSVNWWTTTSFCGRPSLRVSCSSHAVVR